MPIKIVHKYLCAVLGCSTMGNITSSTSINVQDVDQKISAKIQELIKQGQGDDPEQMGLAVLEALIDALVQGNSNLCVPAFIGSQAERAIVKFSVGVDQQGKAWKDVLGVINGVGTIMFLRFRFPEILDGTFSVPFCWHGVHVGDKMTFTLASKHTAQMSA